MKKMISYYDLLKLIQDDEEPELIMLHLNCGSMAYQPIYDDGEFSHYERVVKVENYNSENFKTYLADTLLESQMIEPNIEIVGQQKIEKIGKHFSLHYIKTNIDEETQDEIDNTINEIYDKIDEIIDAINELGE